MFEVEKPLQKLGIGVDALPEDIKNSSVLTGNDLGKLGNIEKIPDSTDFKELLLTVNYDKLHSDSKELHKLAHQLLEENKVMEAWKVLLKL